MRMRRLIVVGVVGLALAACARSSGDRLADAFASATPASAAVLAAQQRDCLQYPVRKLADGSEEWNADYVRYYLVSERDQKLALGADGKPVASGVLHSDVVRLMQRGTIPGTAWTFRVQRSLRVVKDDKVVRESPFVTVDLDAKELDRLLALDRAAR